MIIEICKMQWLHHQTREPGFTSGATVSNLCFGEICLSTLPQLNTWLETVADICVRKKRLRAWIAAMLNASQGSRDGFEMEPSLPESNYKAFWSFTTIIYMDPALYKNLPALIICHPVRY